MKNVMGFAVAGLVTLAAIYLYNRFSGKNVADLGKKTA
jgi:hypothetical protein